MKKVLFVATVTKHINMFHIPYLRMFKEHGYEVHVASNGDENIEYCDKHFNLPFARFPLKINNIKVYKELKKIINENEYEIIHCHTPVGGVLTRLAARKARKNGTRIIYTAHGFHFYKGAPILNWLLFYPIEKFLARYTDTIITINKEDFELAKKKFSKRCKDIQYVPGVGIDVDMYKVKLSDKEKIELKKSLYLNKNDCILTCVARLDKNKNQGFLINVMRELVKNNDNIHLLLVGQDELNGYYQSIVNKNGLSNNVHFLGNREEIPNILAITDIIVSASLREGLPVNVIESFAAGKPVIALNCRGIKDLITDDENGYIVDDNTNPRVFAEKIITVFNFNDNEKDRISHNNYIKANKYNIQIIINELSKIYFK